jgi:hypothetical protein
MSDQRYTDALLANGRLREERDKLREALEWYAEQVAGCRKLGSIGDPARHALDADGGKRARTALAKEGK